MANKPIRSFFAGSHYEGTRWIQADLVRNDVVGNAVLVRIDPVNNDQFAIIPGDDLLSVAWVLVKSWLYSRFTAR